MSTSLVNNSVGFAEDPDQEHGLLPDLNGVDLVMSLSPKSNHHHHHHNLTSLQHLQSLQQQHNSSLHNNHSTPFSVTDILSPIEESYRKLELSTNPPSPYRFVYFE